MSSPLVVHRGGCHCGRVRFEVDAPAVIDALDCNCSLCRMTGFLHLIVPASQFRLVAGESDLTTYTFNTGVAKHRFCRVCGIKSFYVPRSNPDGIDVNVRCLDDSTIERLNVAPFDGRNWEQSAGSLKHLSETVDVVTWDAAYQPDFARLNRAWLEKFFRVEPIDEQLMADPAAHIVAPGGQIFFARVDGRIVGTGAVLRESDGVYELGKMAVDEAMQGRGLGRRIVEAAIAWFQAQGGRTLFLESHSSLAPALALYESTGFVRQPDRKADSHYARSDVYMVWRPRAGDPQA